MADYRHRKELFVSNLNGTSLFETGSIMINICATYFLCQILKSSKNTSSLSSFIQEYSILVVPMILICTVLSLFSHIFHFMIWFIGFFIYFTKNNTFSKSTPTVHKSYSRIIEIFRGEIIIATCICILAVDFPIFPRRYAKTEDYGYSIMDLGVGQFAIAHGLVSAEVRNKQTTLKELLLENVVLCLLGVIRFVSVKYFSYVEHVSEYGVHWNFFLTLCFMKLIGFCLLKSMKNVLLLIIIMVTFHEFILLQYFEFDQYLITSDNLRANFIDANREGIFSLGGYVCLYLIGIYFGRLIMKNEYEQKFKQMGVQFFILTIVLCALSYNPSRKLCNLSYISSTVGLACMCLGCFSMLQWLLARKNYMNESILLMNVNRKGLDTFLLANVLTGIVNLNINTIDASEWASLTVIFIYMLVATICAVFVPSVIKLILKKINLSK